MFTVHTLENRTVLSVQLNKDWDRTFYHYKLCLQIWFKWHSEQFCICKFYCTFIMRITVFFCIFIIRQVKWKQIIILFFQFLLAELNSFYLKFVLWIPPEHYINLTRLVFFLFMGAAALRETFQFLDDPYVPTFSVKRQTCFKSSTLIRYCMQILFKVSRFNNRQDTSNICFPLYYTLLYQMVFCHPSRSLDTVI